MIGYNKLEKKIEKHLNIERNVNLLSIFQNCLKKSLHHEKTDLKYVTILIPGFLNTLGGSILVPATQFLNSNKIEDFYFTEFAKYFFLSK